MTSRAVTLTLSTIVLWRLYVSDIHGSIFGMLPAIGHNKA